MLGQLQFFPCISFCSSWAKRREFGCPRAGVRQEARLAWGSLDGVGWDAGCCPPFPSPFVIFSPEGYPEMAKALNATGRPIIYSCSWPAYQGGLPPKVRVVLSDGCFSCPLCPGGVLVGAAGAACYTPLIALPLGRMGLQVPRGHVASLPGIWGHLGFPAWLSGGSLGETRPSPPHSAGMELVPRVCSPETGPVWFKCLK